MPRPLRFILLFAGFIPYAVKLPYMLNAWQTSPQDKYDWIFIFLFTLLFPLVWTLTRKRHQVSQIDCHALFLLIPAVVMYIISWITQINAAQIFCAIAIAFAVFWLIYGGQNTYRMFPTFALLGLGVTSTTYWLNYYISSPHILPGLIFKAVSALILILWLLSNYLWEKKVRSETILFAGSVCIVIIIIGLNGMTVNQQGTPVILNLEEAKKGTFIGRAQDVTKQDIRFFGSDSVIDRYYFVGTNKGIFVLAITCGQKVNSIHPASHCLRTSGWTIVSEKIKKMEINGKTFYIDEIITENNNSTFLMWVWYSNSGFSTSSFVYFRRMWNQSETWHTYQIMISLDNRNQSSIHAAQDQLQDFVQTFAIEN